MDKEKAIEKIDEYLLEPNNINKEWVECLQMCKQALLENVSQKAEIERLEFSNEHWNDWEVKCRAVKEFAERLKLEDCTRFIEEYYLNGEMYSRFRSGLFSDFIDNLVKEMVGDKE